MGEAYEHCGTDGYFGNTDWSKVSWPAIEKPATRSDFPPANYPATEQAAETDVPELVHMEITEAAEGEIV